MGVNRIKVNYFEEDPQVSSIPVNELERDDIVDLGGAVLKNKELLSVELDVHLTNRQDCHALSLLVSKIINKFD